MPEIEEFQKVNIPTWNVQPDYPRTFPLLIKFQKIKQQKLICIKKIFNIKY